ncbi:MAG TPA: PepSY-like domain-containing protein [Myxococcota bacterium]|jgi:hypothetical protein|nr:PepSY-like domain-containing protein [Myxococcota bacterium]
MLTTLRSRLAGATIVVLSLAALGDGARAAEKKVALDAVPAAVLDAVKARFKDAALLAAEEETEGGKRLYEVRLKTKEGQTVEVSATPEGALVTIEKTIDVKDLPAPARTAVEGKYPKATLKRVEEVTKVTKGVEALAHYEVLLVTAEKKKLEVLVTPAGELLPDEDDD